MSSIIYPFDSVLLEEGKSAGHFGSSSLLLHTFNFDLFNQYNGIIDSPYNKLRCVSFPFSSSILLHLTCVSIAISSSPHRLGMTVDNGISHLLFELHVD